MNTIKNLLGLGLLSWTGAFANNGELLTFTQAAADLAAGAEEVRVEVTGAVERVLDEDDYLLLVDGETILLDTWNSGLGLLTVGETVTVAGELERAYEVEYGVTVEYELDAESGTSSGGTGSTGGGTDGGTSDGGTGNDDSDEPGPEPGVSDFAEAVERLAAGAEEVRVEVTGAVERVLDEDDYLLLVDGETILLDTWNSGLGLLTVGETVTVAGELERAYEVEYGVTVEYELDALGGDSGGESGEPGGSGEGDGSDNGDNPGEGESGLLWEDLGEAMAYLEANPMVEEVRIRVTGTVEERLSPDEEDEDYRFRDALGNEVVVDLDRRVAAEFAWETGAEVTVAGELERSGEFASAGLVYEIDVWEMSWADGERLDLANGTELSGSVISDWLGILRPQAEGWAEHSSLGSVYPAPQPDGVTVLYVAGESTWLVTGPELHPLAYSPDLGWLWVAGSPYGDSQHGYQFETGEWHLYLGGKE